MLIVLFFGGFNCSNNVNQASYVSFLKKNHLLLLIVTNSARPVRSGIQRGPVQMKWNLSFLNTDHI